MKNLIKSLLIIQNKDNYIYATVVVHLYSQLTGEFQFQFQVIKYVEQFWKCIPQVIFDSDPNLIMVRPNLDKTAESPTTILIQGWFKNYELKWGFGGLHNVNLYQFGWI